MQRFFRSSIQGQPAQLLLTALYYTFEASLEASKYMHAHRHKPIFAQLCLHQHNQAGNGFYRYFDIYIMADVCLKTPALSY